MKTIYKYKLSGDFPSIKTHKGAKILKVDIQLSANSICIWLEVNTENEMVERHFSIIATGQRFDEEGRVYIGTIFMTIFVWHIYEDIE